MFHGRRLLRRADGHVSAALCPCDPRPRPSTDRPRGSHRTPTAAWTAPQLRNAFSENEAGTLSTARSRSVFADATATFAGMNIQTVRTAPRSPWQNVYVGGRHRHDPTRVPLSCNRDKGGGAFPRSALGRRALPVLAQRHLTLGKDTPMTKPDPAAVSRPHRRHSRSRRLAPPLRPHRGISRRAASMTATPGRTARLLNTSVAVNCY